MCSDVCTKGSFSGEELGQSSEGGFDREEVLITYRLVSLYAETENMRSRAVSPERQPSAVLTL